MKILNVTAQKPHSTGSGTYLTELTRSFEALGHEQAVISAFDADLSFPIVGMSDIMPYESTRYQDMTPAMIDEFESSFIKAIAKSIDEFKPDLIICHHLFLLTALVRKHFPNEKIYGICHGTCLRQMKNAQEYLAKTQESNRDKWFIDIPDIAENIRKLDRIFALHEEQAREIEDIFASEDNDTDLAAKITVVGSGYNSSLFNLKGREDRHAGDPVRICYAGKISSPKGVPELLRSLAALDDEFGPKTFELTLVGGCLEPELIKAMAELPAYAKYLEPLPQAELAKVYKQNDILVLPSYFEGLSLVPIEAMASGLLPICTDLPGMRPWIDEHVGNPNIRYIPRPEMASIDQPTDAGRTAFTHDLTALLRTAIQDIRSGNPEPVPDTSKITWDEIANKIL